MVITLPCEGAPVTTTTLEWHAGVPAGGGGGVAGAWRVTITRDGGPCTCDDCEAYRSKRQAARAATAAAPPGQRAVAAGAERAAAAACTLPAAQQAPGPLPMRGARAADAHAEARALLGLAARFRRDLFPLHWGLEVLAALQAAGWRPGGTRGRGGGEREELIGGPHQEWLQRVEWLRLKVAALRSKGPGGVAAAAGSDPRVQALLLEQAGYAGGRSGGEGRAAAAGGACAAGGAEDDADVWAEGRPGYVPDLHYDSPFTQVAIL